MFDFVTQANEKQHIRFGWRVICSPEFLKTCGQFPSLPISIDQFEVTTVTLFPVKRLNLSLEKYSVKHSGPRDTHQYYKTA
jgi:hypothetical protein